MTRLNKGITVRLFLSAFAFILCLTQNHAQIKTWTGAVDTNWTTSGNWSPSGVPGPGSIINIPDVVNDPVSSIEIIIQAGDTMTIDSGASLRVAGAHTVENGIRVLGVVHNNGHISVDRTNSDGLENLGYFFNYKDAMLATDSTEDSGIFNRVGGNFYNWGTVIMPSSQFSGIENYGNLMNFGSISVSNTYFECLYLDVSGYSFVNYGHIILNRTISTNDALITADDGYCRNQGCGKIEIISNDRFHDFSDVFVNNAIISEKGMGTSSVDVNNGVVQNLNGGGFNIGTNNGGLTTMAYPFIDRTVLNTSDTSGGSLRRVIDCSMFGDTILFGRELNNQIISLTSDSIYLDQEMSFFAVDSTDTITIDASVLPRMFHLPPGMKCTFNGVSLRSGFTDNGGVFLNEGTLTLLNLDILQNPVPGSGPRIFGNGTYILKRNIEISP